MAKLENRSAPLGLRIRPSLKTALEKLAQDDRRTLASYVELILEQHVDGNVAKPTKKK
jgi:hypothetical protein